MSRPSTGGAAGDRGARGTSERDEQLMGEISNGPEKETREEGHGNKK